MNHNRTCLPKLQSRARERKWPSRKPSHGYLKPSSKRKFLSMEKHCCRAYNSFQMLQPTISPPHYLIHLNGPMPIPHFFFFLYELHLYSYD